jgi:hypothetical protein
MSGDVLRRNASGSLIESIVIQCLFFGGEFVLGMSIQESSIAAQREHEQQLGIHSRGRHLSGRQALDRRTESVAKKHPAISPQPAAVKALKINDDLLWWLSRGARRPALILLLLLLL